MNLDGVNGAVTVDLASAMTTTTTKVSQLVDEMQDSVIRIGRASADGVSDWKGRASGAFDTSQGDWNVAAVALNQALDGIRRQLNTGFAGYEDSDAASAGAIPEAGTAV